MAELHGANIITINLTQHGLDKPTAPAARPAVRRRRAPNPHALRNHHHANAPLAPRWNRTNPLGLATSETTVTSIARTSAFVDHVADFHAPGNHVRKSAASVAVVVHAPVILTHADTAQLPNLFGLDEPKQTNEQPCRNASCAEAAPVFNPNSTTLTDSAAASSTPITAAAAAPPSVSIAVSGAEPTTVLAEVPHTAPGDNYQSRGDRAEATGQQRSGSPAGFAGMLITVFTHRPIATTLVIILLVIVLSAVVTTWMNILRAK